MADGSRPHILLILGSTREGRFSEVIGRWLLPILEAREDMTVELVDLRDWKLPYYDRGSVAAASDYENDELCLRWADMVARGDGYVIISPEYNYGYPAVLKSALDAVYKEWNRKPVAFVGYGGWSGGSRGVQQLRLVAVELQMVPVRGTMVLQFALRLFDESGQPKDADFYGAAATRMIDDLAWWAKALKAAREADAG
jgi:NAD(P)H-dependent FMN reductase